MSGFPVPSDDFTSKLTESLEGVFSHQSAAWNNNISIRNDIASELENFLHKEFPGTPLLVYPKVMYFCYLLYYHYKSFSAKIESGYLNIYCMDRCNRWYPWLQCIRVCTTWQ